jgi:hypothetical protein
MMAVNELGGLVVIPKIILVIVTRPNALVTSYTM